MDANLDPDYERVHATAAHDMMAGNSAGSGVGVELPGRPLPKQITFVGCFPPIWFGRRSLRLEGFTLQGTPVPKRSGGIYSDQGNQSARGDLSRSTVLIPVPLYMMRRRVEIRPPGAVLRAAVIAL